MNKGDSVKTPLGTGVIAEVGINQFIGVKFKNGYQIFKKDEVQLL